jgi:SAM-dependent methyltransferase
MGYLETNAALLPRGYFAPNVESWVFRWNGRVLNRLRPRTIGVSPGTLLDWGCGSGATAAYFARQGYDVYGVDSSAPDIERAKTVASRAMFKCVPAAPSMQPYFPGVKFDVVTAIQALYFLSPADIAIAVASLREQMHDGGILYATMVGSRCWFSQVAEPQDNGMHKITAKTDRYDATSFVTLTPDKETLISMFPGFKPLLVGYYDADWGEGSEFHWHITAAKIP